MEWLEEHGQRLTKPHAEKISKYIYELKVHREDGIMIFPRKSGHNEELVLA